MQNSDTFFSEWKNQWWEGIDKSLLVAYGLLISIGIILVSAGSPSVADRIGIGTHSFLQKHLIILIPSVLIALGISTLNLRGLRLFALALLFGSIGAILLTLLIGVEIKGAKRWLDIASFSLQPSEFVKPSYAFICAWLFSTQRNDEPFPNFLIGERACYKIGFILAFIIMALLLFQPDWGQTLLVAITLFSLLVMIGISLLMCGLVVFAIMGLFLLGYYYAPHVQVRFDNYFTREIGYQASKSLKAFESGGLLGRGPAEGIEKISLPDSHTDFIFAVAAEEFGFIFCLIILSLYIFVFGRVIWRVLQQNNYFIILASVALIVQLSAQTFINIASSLNLVPTTGMTLPLISYGGSSLLAVNITFGLLLGLTRKRIFNTN